MVDDKTPQELSELVDSAVIFPHSKDIGAWQYYKLGVTTEQHIEKHSPNALDSYKLALGCYLKAIETDTKDIAESSQSMPGRVELYEAARAVVALLETKVEDANMKQIYNNIDSAIIAKGVKNKIYSPISPFLVK